MTLDQYQDLRLWHLRHQDSQPLEAHAWTIVLTLWLVGWVGSAAAALLLGAVAALSVGALVLLPSAYVAWRDGMHRRGTLRCDWIAITR